MHTREQISPCHHVEGIREVHGICHRCIGSTRMVEAKDQQGGQIRCPRGGEQARVGDIIVRMPVVFSLSSRFSRGRSSAPLLRTTIVLFLVVDQGLMLLWFYGVWSSEFAVQSTSRVEYTEMEDRIVAAPMTVWLAWTERFCDACSHCRYGIPDDTFDTPSRLCRTVNFGDST